MASEKWVVIGGDYENIDEAYGIFESERDAEQYLREYHPYADWWRTVRIRRPESEIWA